MSLLFSANLHSIPVGMESAQETLSFARLNISLDLLEVPRPSVDTQAYNAKMMKVLLLACVVLAFLSKESLLIRCASQLTFGAFEHAGRAHMAIPSRMKNVNQCSDTGPNTWWWASELFAIYLCSGIQREGDMAAHLVAGGMHVINVDYERGGIGHDLARDD
eukprot:2838495-Pleurochrysis_carterae.AAC.1